MSTLRNRRDEARKLALLIIDALVRESSAGDCDWAIIERDAKRLAQLGRDTRLPVSVGEVLERY